MSRARVAPCWCARSSSRIETTQSPDPRTSPDRPTTAAPGPSARRQGIPVEEEPRLTRRKKRATMIPERDDKIAHHRKRPGRPIAFGAMVRRAIEDRMPFRWARGGAYGFSKAGGPSWGGRTSSNVMATTRHDTVVTRWAIDHPVHDLFNGLARQKWKRPSCGTRGSRPADLRLGLRRSAALAPARRPALGDRPPQRRPPAGDLVLHRLLPSPEPSSPGGAAGPA